MLFTKLFVPSRSRPPNALDRWAFDACECSHEHSDARQVKRTLPSDQYSTEARAYTEHTRTLADNTEPKAPATHISNVNGVPTGF